MNYNFDEIIDRRGTDSSKWQVSANELPLTIADMDFKTAPEIISDLKDKVATGVFGYENPPEEYFAAVIDWYQKMHHAKIQREWMIFATGVIPALSSLVRRLSRPAENVVVQSPVYNIFYNSIENNGRKVLENQLAYDKKTRTYRIDFLDLAAKLEDPQTTMMILCNPHNPTGQVWSPDTLERIVKLCCDNHVVLISDEIHGDLVLDGPDYTPIFSLEPELRNHTVALVSPSKTFNVAALHAATVIVPEPFLRHAVDRGLNNEELAEPNLAAIPGTIAAYRYGSPWLAELKSYLLDNRQLVEDALTDQMKLVKGSATYLLWLDCSAFEVSSGQLAAEIRQQTGLILSPGKIFRGNGDQFLRMNIAYPRKVLKDALKRLTSFSI
ncbi:MalY/PatB family protein [Xylocopilactobacillus apicola]|uniref:cysteine-S-conjugate beta-lyase n=1 Tax=Xylocopilactobacillus apicola TaxID=2932184 RepID=A0AAU9CZI7_9LACO|nr:PatB family C-S lyase [Xylocopilactobacillus apicola]BDR57846.1 cystathionine beta-lyase [Xylocopilactobacillus apicola]